MNVLIADDHPLVRDGICNILRHLHPGLSALEASDLAEASRLVEQRPDLDLILLDLYMPGMNGTHGVEVMRRLAPSTPLIVISASEDQRDIQACIDSGASGYIAKSTAKDVLSSALQLVMAGGIYIPPQLLVTSSPGPGTSEHREESMMSLTDRQCEVVERMALGDTNKEIGRFLGIAEKTVKAHLSSIFRLLGASNRTHAVRIARESGIIDRLNERSR